MSSDKTIEKLHQEIARLQVELAEQRVHSYRCQEEKRKLQEREAYNFSLFQFNPFHTVVVDRNGRVIKSNAAKLHSGDRVPNIGDSMYRDYASRHSIDMYAELMRCIETGQAATYPETKYGNKYLAITISPFPNGAIIVSRDITAEKKMELQQLSMIHDLQQALEHIDTIKDFLPICASCKRIRDDDDCWLEVEDYFKHRDHLEFSHTICPECMQRMYPEVWAQIEQKRIGREAMTEKVPR